MSGVPYSDAAELDFTMVRAALVRRLGGIAYAYVWSRIHYRCKEPWYSCVEDETGRWWCVTQDVIAEETGMTVDAVRHALKSLSDGGFIETARHQRGGNYDRTCSYRVVFSDDHAPSSGTSTGSTRGAPQAVDLPDEEAGDVPLHSLEENLLEVVHATTQASTPRKPQKKSNFQGREPDDETSSAGEDAPALGSDPTARQENLRKAATSGTTGGGLAERLKRGLELQGMHVTASAVARTLNADFALPRGPSRELQREMVDLFIRNHAQYTPNDKLPAWQRFLAQRSSIAVDAKAILARRARAEKEIGANPEDDAAWFAQADIDMAERRKKEAEKDELLRQH